MLKINGIILFFNGCWECLVFLSVDGLGSVLKHCGCKKLIKFAIYSWKNCIFQKYLEKFDALLVASGNHVLLHGKNERLSKKGIFLNP